jgi:hypothetical protein
MNMEQEQEDLVVVLYDLIREDDLQRVDRFEPYIDFGFCQIVNSGLLILGHMVHDSEILFILGMDLGQEILYEGLDHLFGAVDPVEVDLDHKIQLRKAAD